MLAVAEAIYTLSLWALHRHVARARDHQLWPMLGCLVAIALVLAAVAGGLALSWALLLLSVGPVILIAYNEHGRRRYVDCFAVR